MKYIYGKEFEKIKAYPNKKDSIFFTLYSLIVIVAFLVGGCSLEEDSSLIYTGTVEADGISLSTEIGGKINNVFIEEGQPVVKGTKIAEIDIIDFKIKLKKAKAALSATQEKLKELIDGARGEEIENARANMKNIEMQLEGAVKNLEYREQSYNDIAQLFDNSAASKQQVNDAKALVDKEETIVKSLEKQLVAARASLDLLLSGATKQKIKIAEAEVDMNKAEVELLENQILKGDIICPIDGVVESTYRHVGEFVSVGGNITRIISLKNLWVKIYIPQKELHRVSINQLLNLSTDFMDNESLKGKVTYISPEAEFTPKNVESKENKEEMVFEVKIEILDDNSILKPGMLVDVNLEENLQ